ncbi:MAG: putative extracellular nuclease [Saprospiraceae bacterium]|jgi:predicted extracellular nuclease
MYRLLPFFLLLITISAFQSCKDTKTGKIDLDVNYRIGFYNVENLFDTIDTPDKMDEDFTPTGKLSWNTERYNKKLSNLDKVIAGMQYPTLLGVCEIENEAVLKDLASNTGMSKYNYGIVHYESPDKRGIDNALLYQKKYFKVESSDKIRIEFPANIAEDYTSRDIIYAKGIFLGKYTLHVFVNHWPSRRGGEKESQPKRVLVAQHLREAVDKIFAKDPNANIVIIGDMNDEPDNDSILKTLRAGEIVDQTQALTLYNCMAKLKQQNKGTYNYRGNWNMLDNIICSSNLLNPASKIYIQNPTIFQEEWMMFDHPKNGKTPNRTYGGPNYYGGTSDHLPVYVDLKVRGEK